MRTKEERRMLHITQKPKSKNTVPLSRQNATYNKTVRGVKYSVVKEGGQEYYQELKTLKQVEKEK